MRIFFDLDGTLVRWEAPNSPESLYKQGFYLHMQSYKEVENAFRNLYRRGYELYILTCYPSDNIISISEKTMWMKKNLSFDPDSGKCFFSDYTKGFSGLMEMIPHGVLKGDCLIDDDLEHLIEFEKAGGNSIRIINDVNNMDEWNGVNVNYSSQSLFEDIIETIRYKLIKIKREIFGETVLYRYEIMYVDDPDRFAGYISEKLLDNIEEISIKKRLLESDSLFKFKFSTMEISAVLRYLINDIAKHNDDIKIKENHFMITRDYFDKTIIRIENECKNAVDKELLKECFYTDIDRFKLTGLINPDNDGGIIISPEFLELFDFVKEEEMIKRSVELETRYFLERDAMLLDASNEIKVQFEIIKKKQKLM